MTSSWNPLSVDISVPCRPFGVIADYSDLHSGSTTNRRSKFVHKGPKSDTHGIKCCSLLVMFNRMRDSKSGKSGFVRFRSLKIFMRLLAKGKLDLFSTVGIDITFIALKGMTMKRSFCPHFRLIQLQLKCSRSQKCESTLVEKVHKLRSFSAKSSVAFKSISVEEVTISVKYILTN